MKITTSLKLLERENSHHATTLTSRPSHNPSKFTLLCLFQFGSAPPTSQPAQQQTRQPARSSAAVPNRPRLETSPGLPESQRRPPSKQSRKKAVHPSIQPTLTDTTTDKKQSDRQKDRQTDKERERDRQKASHPDKTYLQTEIHSRVQQASGGN